MTAIHILHTSPSASTDYVDLLHCAWCTIDMFLHPQNSEDLNYSDKQHVIRIHGKMLSNTFTNNNVIALTSRKTGPRGYTVHQ